LMDRLTVAVVQAGTPLFDTEHTLEKVRKYCREAAQQGAALIVFPEAFLGGYPKGLSFGAHVGSRTEEGREEFRRYYEAAVEARSEEVVLLGKIAEEHGI